MRLEINSRGNGACPLCEENGDCHIQKLLASGVEGAGDDSEMEIVVYACPYFAERVGD
jgi:NADH-ubiquinone oxidoreductase-G iron-sulfur binding region.